MACDHARHTIDPVTLAAVLRDQTTEEEELCRDGDAEEQRALKELTAKRLAFADAISTMSREELSVTLRVDVHLGDHAAGVVELTSAMELIDFLVLRDLALPHFSSGGSHRGDHGEGD
jgi:hypothetical protein